MSNAKPGVRAKILAPGSPRPWNEPTADYVKEDTAIGWELLQTVHFEAPDPSTDQLALSHAKQLEYDHTRYNPL